MSGSLLNKQSTKLIPTSNRSRHGSEHGKELEYYIFSRTEETVYMTMLFPLLHKRIWEPIVMTNGQSSTF